MEIINHGVSRAIGLRYQEDFKRAPYGTTFNSAPEFTSDGAVLDGTDAIIWSQDTLTTILRNPTEGFTIVLDFTPSASFKSGTIWHVFSMDTTGLFQLYKDVVNTWKVVCSGVTLASVVEATWDAQWNDTERNRVVISCKTGASAIYVNGTSVDSGADAWTDPGAIDAMTIGARFTTYTNRCNGTYHDLQVYDWAMDALSVAALERDFIKDLLDENCLITLPGKRSYFSGATLVTEAVGTAGVTEALMGSDGLTAAEYPSLVYPRGHSFDGVNDQITISDYDDLSFTSGGVDQPFTLFALVYVASFPNNIGVFGKGATTNSGEYHMYIGVDGSVIFRQVDDNAGARKGRKAPAGTIVAGQLYSLIGRSKGTAGTSDIDILVNNVAVDTSNANSGVYVNMQNTATALVIGMTPTVAFPGDIILPGIANRYLSNIEVKAKTELMYQTARLP